MSRNDYPPKCIGFGEFEGKCKNIATSLRTRLWCDRCNNLRISHITKQMQEIVNSFNVKGDVENRENINNKS